METAPRSIRSVLAVLLAAAAATFLFAPGLTQPASAGGSPCTEFGDTRPTNLKPSQAQRAIVCLINAERRSHGRGGLDGDNRLHEAARKHSSKMADRNRLSHQLSGEASLAERLRRVGYLVSGLTRWAYGENIAYGDGTRGTPREIVRAWMNSSGHRANILSGLFRDVGAGFAKRGDRGYYTADFGLRQR